MTNLFAAAKDKLKNYSPEEICLKAGVSFSAEEQLYSIRSFGGELKLKFPSYDPQHEITDVREMWYLLTLLQYLDTADGTPLCGNWITLSQMPGGAARSVGFQKEADHAFARAAYKTHSEEFRKACLQLGAVPADGKGDVSCLIYFAPRFPVLINFWEADEDFSASVRMYVDAMAEHYLTLEGAGTACGCVINRITDIVASL